MFEHIKCPECGSDSYTRGHMNKTAVHHMLLTTTWNREARVRVVCKNLHSFRIIWPLGTDASQARTERVTDGS